MKTEKASSTAAYVAALRALYTTLPEPYRIAPDPLAGALVPFPLGLPAAVVAHAPWAAAAIHHGLGFATMGLSHYVPLRTRAIDDALRDAVESGATQLVVLGAGLDNRAYRLDELASVRAFEIDYPSTQRDKVARLDALPSKPAPAAKSLVRVPVDFEHDRLDQALFAAGFDPSARTFWIWEGVVVYLTREAISGTLAAVSALSAPGSRIALTYSPPRMVMSWALPFARRALDLVGEPFRTPLSPDEMNDLLRAAGLTRFSDESSVEWAARYWPGMGKSRAIERLSIAEKR
ncbi:MAG: SAM-dependent methyltransferase [Byssovorax sp.]